MPDFVDATVQDLDQRLGELHEEQRKLEAARAALVGSTLRRPGRPPRTGRAVTTTTVDSPARTERDGRTTRRRAGVHVHDAAGTRAQTRSWRSFARHPGSPFRRSPSDSRSSRTICTASFRGSLTTASSPKTARR